LAKNENFSLVEVSAWVSAMTLVFSILYEWSYLRVIDFKLTGAISISDFVELAIGWLPTTLLLYMVLAMNEFLTQGIERGQTEDEIVASSPTPKFTKGFRKAPSILIPLVLVFGSLFQVIFASEVSYFFVGVLAVSLWATFASRVSSVPRIQEKYTSLLCSLFVLVPIVVMTILTLGAMEAELALKAKKGPYDISFNDGEELKEVQILRLFDQGALIRDPSEASISFELWSEVAEFTKYSEPPGPKTSFACRVFDWACWHQDG